MTRRTTSAAALVLFLVSCAVSGQERHRVPALTTEDVMTQRGKDQVLDETAATGATSSAKTAAAKAAEKKVSPEEIAWRALVKQARERVKQAEKIAEDTELRVTELRNEVNRSGQTPNDRNVNLAAMEAAQARLPELRAAARQEKAALEELLAQGREKSYTEDSGPTPTKDGKPNEEYFRTRFAKLNEEMNTASRRVDLYNDRVRDLNQRINQNSRTGDNFFIMQLQKDRDEAQQSLDEAKQVYEKAAQAVEALKEEARINGVPPGVFR